ncbi:DUF4179 domain-containing protein [Paenibacillus azoreducens]|uniref:DUF4179 domain-containing protein n=1 Tax=Paenibacillus azoreducens TaxID=116718 RepID=A0A919YI27_9BACL|nr:DUF4179 domain-containing protein [Paenibacillus azoreducens]GIO50864.1 hypothetical protein J34TS1_56290 [Paenibacillus azoreducens]
MNRDRIYGDENLRQQDALLRSKTQEMPDRLGNLVPHTTFQAVWGKHHQFLMQNGVRSKRKKRWGIAACGLVMAIIVAGTAFYTSPEVRAALAKFPFMKMLLKDGEFKEHYGLSQIEKQDLGVKLNRSVTDQNIRFTVDEIFYDGIQIVLNYDVEYLNAKEKINEKDASVYYNLAIIGAEPDMMSTHKFTILNDHSFIGSTLIDAYQYLDGYQLQMNISQIGQVKGDWSVTIPLSVSKTDPHTKTFFPNKVFEMDGKKRTVERITMTPVTTQIVIRSEDKKEGSDLSFNIRDNLQTLFYSNGGLAGNGKYINNFAPPSSINPYPEYIEIAVNKKMRMNHLVQHEETAALTNKFPIILKGAHGGTVLITKVEYSEDGTMLYYEASDAENQYPMIVLMDSKEHVNISEPVRIAKDRFAFKMKYPKLDIRSSLKAKVFINEYEPGYKPEPPVWVKIPLDWSKP